MEERPTYQELEARIEHLENENTALSGSLRKTAESEQFHRMILESISDAVIVADDDGNIRYVCPNTTHIFGRSAEDIYRLGTLDNLLNGAVCDVAELRRLHEIGNIKWSVKDASGHERFLLITAKSVHISGGTALYVMRDVTREKQVEKKTAEEFRVSERRFRSALENVQLIALELNAEGKVLFCNDFLLQHIGWSREEMVGRDWFGTFVSEHERDSLRAVHAENVNGGNRFTYHENFIRTKDGRFRLIRWTNTALRDKNNRITSIISLGEDLTERKQLEDRNALLSQIVDIAPASVTIHDDEGRFFYANRIALDQHGYETLSDFLSVNLSDMEDPESKSLFKARSSQIFERGQSRFDVMHHRKDGSTFPLEVQAKSIFWEGRPAILSIATDITERKQAESRLRQAQRIEAVGTLAGGIAHDFNNLLFPITGMAEMLLEDIPPAHPHHDFVAEIYRAARRAGALVKQILSFSSQSDIHKIPVRWQQILKEVLKLSRATIPSNVEIHHGIQPECGLVSADPTQLHQIALNLITNAYHAVEDTGGAITVALKEVRPEAAGAKSPVQGPCAVLSVSDTGCGIDPAVIHRIFEPYFTTKPQGKGTGLGLSVVYGIVKEYGGEIQVKSELGKGTVCEVYLPLLEKTVPPAAPEKAISDETGTERILLVDDEAPIVRIETQMLERLGYRVTSRLSSPDALAAFRNDPAAYDLVLTDMAMPHLTGIQLAEALIAVRPDIPIVLCTGFSEKVNEETIAAAGIRCLLMKPIVTSDLARMVRRVLDEAKKGSGSDS